MRAAWQPTGVRSNARGMPGVRRVRSVRLGVVVLPEFRWSTARALWRRVEELGFDHAWTYDHLAWRSLRDATWFGAVPFLAAGAVVTERIRLGTLVASPNFRHPVPFARELVTLDDLSGGRLTLGIGAGADGWDAVMLGQDPWSPAERAERFAEFLELLDRLLREPETSYEGRFYSAGRGAHLSRVRAAAPGPVRGGGHGASRDAAGRHPRADLGDDGRPRPRGTCCSVPRRGCAVVREQMDASGRSLRRGGARPGVDRPTGAERPPPRSRADVARRLR